MTKSTLICRALNSLLVAIVLSACAASPQVKKELGQLSWRTGFGGALVGYCQSGQSLWLFSADQIERFDLSSDARPLIGDRFSYWFGNDRAKSNQIECRPDAVQLRTPDGQKIPLRGSPSVASVWTTALPLNSESVAFPIRAGQILEVSGRGWLIKKNKSVLDWRSKPSDLIAATVDGDRIWAISSKSLWKIDLEHRRIAPVALPNVLVQRGLAGLFMDGRVVWIRDQTQSAHPLSIRGYYAHPMAGSGPVNLAGQSVELPLGSGQLNWSPDDGAVTFRKGHSNTVLADSANRLLVLTSAHVMLALGSYLEIWHVGGSKPEKIGRYSMPGKTIGLFKLGRRVISVGTSYGVIVGDFENQPD